MLRVEEGSSKCLVWNAINLKTEGVILNYRAMLMCATTNAYVGLITTTQGTEELGLLSHNCSRIVEAHRGSAWKIADFPNPVGTVTKQSRPSNTASLCSCLTDG